MAGQDEIFFLLTRPQLFLPLFLLVLFRVSGLMIAAPIYASDIVPVRLRIALAATISFVLFPALSPRLPLDMRLSTAVAGVFGELMIGFIMGLSVSMIFEGVKLAGRIIGQQAGLALGQVFDPITNSQSTVFGQVFFWVAIAIFMISGGHRELMRALLDTFDVIPVMSFRFDQTMFDLLVGSLSGAYALALRLSGPVLMALILTSIVLGFLSRTIPQINILTVGFAVRVFVAVGVTGIVILATEELLVGGMSDLMENIRAAFGLAV